MKEEVTSLGVRMSEQGVRDAAAWREAAVADGWAVVPTYPSHEGTDRAATLERSGWKVLVLSRTPDEHTRVYQGAVHAWGPDGLNMNVPLVYPGWDALQALLLRCVECDRQVEHVQRVGFAGRCCDACLSEARKRYEFSGWTR